MRRFSMIAAFAACIVASGCAADSGPRAIPLSEAKLQREAVSPDRRLTARYYIDMGGGAAGWVEEMVDIRAPADTTPIDPTDLVFLMSNGGGVTLKWEGSRALRIEYPQWATVIRGCRSARGVAISYGALARPDSAWGIAGYAAWHDDSLLQADQARRGEPPIRDKSPGLVGTCS